MSKIFFFITLFLASQILVAQTDQHVVPLSVPKQMSKLGFEIAEVLDRRIDKSNIGFAQIGDTNKRIPAVLPDNFETYITETLEKMVVSKGEKLTIIIHEFYIAEHTKLASTLARFRIQMEFAKSIEGKLYSVGYSEQVVEGIGENVEIRFGKFIMNGLKKCLTEFARSDWQEEQGELIEDTFDIKYDYTKIPKRGLYSSFAKMARNEPFMESDFIIKGTEGQRGVKYHRYYVEDKRGRRLKKRIFGFSYGNKFYLNASRYCHGSYYVRAKLVGKYIYFEDFQIDPLATALFGVIGTIASSKTIGIAVDTETGFLVVLNDHEMKELLKKYPEVEKTYLQSKQKYADKLEAMEAINKLY